MDSIVAMETIPIALERLRVTLVPLPVAPLSTAHLSWKLHVSMYSSNCDLSNHKVKLPIIIHLIPNSVADPGRQGDIPPPV